MSKARSDDEMFHCPIDPTIFSLRYTKISLSTIFGEDSCNYNFSRGVWYLPETAELHIYYDDLLERIGISNVKYGKAWSSAPSNVAAP